MFDLEEKKDTFICSSHEGEKEEEGGTNPAVKGFHSLYKPKGIFNIKLYLNLKGYKSSQGDRKSVV